MEIVEDGCHEKVNLKKKKLLHHLNRKATFIPVDTAY